MKFSVNKDALLDALSPIGKVVPKNPSIPILDHFHFDVNDKHAIITGCDLEVMMRGRVPVESDGVLSAAIPAKVILDFVKATDKSCDIIKFEVNEGFVVHLKAGKSKCTISGANGADYPKMDTLKGDEKPLGSFVREVMLDVFKRTLFACGTDDLRPTMMGVNVSVKGGYAKVAATDAHILSFTKAACAGEGLEVTIPIKAVNILQDEKIVTATDVRFYKASNSNLCFQLGNFSLYFRVIDGKYPNYEAVIPQDNPIEVTLNKSDLVGALKRVGIFTSEVTRQVGFKKLGDEVTLTANNIDYGRSASEVIEATGNGEDIEIGFNSRYLTDALANLSGEVVTVRMSAPNKAALFSGDNEDHVVLVMPVMLNV